MSKFVVTGSTGFIGRNLVTELIGLGHEVVTPLRKSSATSAHTSSQVVDVADFDGMVEHFTGSSGVFHLATMFRGNHLPAEIQPMVESNVTLLALVCEAACRAGVPAFVYTESASQHVEGLDYSPSSLYAATKQAGTDIVRYYARRNLRTCCLTLFDTLGPGDTRGKLLSLLERTAAEGGSLQMSPGGQLVDYLFVTDVVAGLIVAMNKTLSVNEENPFFARLSSMAPVPLRQFVEMVGSAIGSPINVDWGAREYREGEMFEAWNWPPVLDGWAPQVSLEAGIRLALDK